MPQLYDLENATLEELSHYRGASMESLVPEAINRRLSAVMTSAGRTMNFVSNEIPKQFKLNLRSSYDLEQTLKRVNYANARQITVPILTGMSTTYQSLAKTLIAAVNHLSNLEEETLEPAEKIINILFGSPDEIRGQFEFPEFAAVKRQYDEMVKCRTALAGCFDQKSHRTYANFGDVFESNTDVREVETSIHELNALTDKINLDKLRKHIRSLEDAASDLVKVINTKQEYNPSAFMAAKLTELMFNAAEQVEFLGAVLTYRQGIYATFTELRSVIEKKLR